MQAANGAGLAAPQIGLNLRLFVMDCDGIKLIAANPEIIATEGEQRFGAALEVLVQMPFLGLNVLQAVFGTVAVVMAVLAWQGAGVWSLIRPTPLPAFSSP